jgi:hypothetical protein
VKSLIGSEPKDAASPMKTTIAANRIKRNNQLGVLG